MVMSQRSRSTTQVQNMAKETQESWKGNKSDWQAEVKPTHGHNLDQRNSINNTIEPPTKKASTANIVPEGADVHTSHRTGSGREVKPVERLTYNEATATALHDDDVIPPENAIFCKETIVPYAQQGDLDPVHVMQASSDPDTMYYHEAMREPDWEEFRSAMQKEWHDQHSNGNFSIKNQWQQTTGRYHNATSSQSTICKTSKMHYAMVTSSICEQEFFRTLWKCH